MKKVIWVLLLTFLLSSCWWDSDEVTRAKQEMWVIAWWTTNVEDEVVSVEPDSDENDDVEKVIEVPTMWDLMNITWDPRIKVTQISGEKLLDLWDLNYDEFKAGHSKISWTALAGVDKIVVSFSNDESDFPSDAFTLQKFKSWDTSFEYNANTKFKVLDFGVNQYRFVAYSGDEKSILELLVVVSKDDKRVLENNGDLSDYNEEVDEPVEPAESDVSVSGVDFDESSLPVEAAYGNIVKLWENSFTYSDIKGLEINKDEFWVIGCWKNPNTDKFYVTELLGEKQNSWYYWNTCTDIVKDKWISFFVTRLDGWEYVYEKHYLDTNHGLYWVYELTRWEWATSSNLIDTNKELKLTNWDYSSLGIVDELFKKVVN